MAITLKLGKYTVAKFGKSAEDAYPNLPAVQEPPQSDQQAQLSIATSAHDDTWENLDVEGRIARYHLKRAKQNLELWETEQRLARAKLDTLHDQVEIDNIESVRKGESGVIPQRRG